jgi:putative ABC transport system ATP-binding protein/lipoprotein-releasing system ATP-binding protein
MGYVFQSYFLLPELTALENVVLPSMIRGRSAHDRANRLLEAVGLGARLNHLPYELSGGEQQRVAIARALINDPRLIFADEPTGNLDRATGDEVMDLLLALVAESQKTLIVVTHDHRLAGRGDRKIVLAEGRIASNVVAPPEAGAAAPSTKP